MTDESITELLLKWDEKRQAGFDPSPEELCVQCPELLDEVRKRISQLKASEWLAGEAASAGPVVQELSAEFRLRAKGHQAKNEFDAAIADASEAIRLDPKYVWAYCTRAVAYRFKGDYDRAIADCNEAIRLDPKYVMAWYNRGESYRMKGNYDLAIADCNEAIRLDPKYSWAYGARGQALYQKGECDRGLADLDETIRLNPGYAWAYATRGENGRLRGDYNLAIADASEAIRLDPKYVWAYGTRASAYLKQSAVDLAIADCNEAIRLDPKYVWAYHSRALAYWHKAEYDLAIADASEAIRLDPKYIWPYGTRASAYLNKSAVDLAIADCNEAIRLDPKYAFAYETRALAYRLKNEIDLAFADANKASDLVVKETENSSRSSMALRIRLRGINGDVEGRTWESPSFLRVGRHASNEIVLDDHSVSRRHAEARPSSKGWVVRDLGSTNGTFLNGTKLGPGEWPIRAHDIIRFGNVTFVAEMLEFSEPESGELPQGVTRNRPNPGHCKRLWHAIFPGNRPLATPAIANGKVFVGGGFGSHEFYAFSADTGEQLWQYHTTDDGPTAAIVEEDLVAFNTESCELEVLTVEGKLVWKKWLGDPLMSIPAAAHGRVFIVYPDSQGDRRHYLACFELRTGELVWRQPISADAITTPVLAEENVYLTTVDGTIWCFRHEDGTLVWVKARNATSSPSIWNKTCYYSRREITHEMAQSECVSRSQPERKCEDFERTWCRADYLDYSKRKTYSQVEALSQTLDGSVGFSTSKGDSSMAPSSANLGHGTVAGVWSYQGSRPFVYRNRLYSCMGRFVQCLDPLSSEIIWKTKLIDGNQPLVDHMLTPPVLVNGKVIVATASGELICLCAETGNWLWREVIGEPIHFQPAVSKGRIYVPTATGNLHCLETGDEKDDGWLMWGGSAAHNGVDDGPMIVPAEGADLCEFVSRPK